MLLVLAGPPVLGPAPFMACPFILIGPIPPFIIPIACACACACACAPFIPFMPAGKPIPIPIAGGDPE